MNDEIKTIALCDFNEKEVKLHTIAHAPHNEMVGDALVQLVANDDCANTKILVGKTLRVSQPRWFIAYNYYMKDA